jgi:hypothetical protein
MSMSSNARLGATRFALVGSVAVSTLLSLSVGLEDPACHHHTWHGGAPASQAAAAAAGHKTHHGLHGARPHDHDHDGAERHGVDHHAHGAHDGGEPSEREDSCRCLGLCVPGPTVAVAVVPGEAPREHLTRRVAEPVGPAAAPRVARTPYLLPYPNPPPAPPFS